ncbi:hypothetical protein P0Y35_05945 [Kiritimatiellaeota bacterium B1221]|nr:hypothetical protein [Kiritimatiellaeota bacterium B1221]
MTVESTQKPLPQSAINDDWADLPELPTIEPAKFLQTQNQPSPEPTQPESSVPETPFPFLPMPNALWSAGILNGSPSGKEDEVISSAEYRNQGATDTTLHISDPKDLPPFIEPNQRLVFHLPGIPKGVYRVNIATTGGGKETIKEEYLEKEKFQQRQLSVRWNDHLLWQRWLPPVFTITQAAIPPPSLSSKSNLLVLENTGTQDIPLDAIWVDAVPTAGNPFYVSLEDAQWLNKRDANWVKNTTLTLILPSIQSNESLPANFIKSKSPRTHKDLHIYWQQVLKRYKKLQSESPELAKAFTPWMQKTGQAVSRGMMPTIEVKIKNRNSANPETFKSALYLFGDLIHTWYIPRKLLAANNLENFRQLAPNALFVSTSGATPGLNGNTITRYPLSFNGLLLEQALKYRRYFDGESDLKTLTSALAETLQLKALFRGYNWHKQAFHADEFFSGAADYLMVHNQPLIIHGGFPGSPFFPAGDDTPGLMWHYLKLLYRFGGPDHFKGTANLTPDSQHSGIGRSSWAVASNGRDSVQVLVRNHIGLNDRKVHLGLPLPWTGPTQVLHHSVRSAWSTTKKPETVSVRKTIEARGKDMEGWINIPFNLQGIQLFELCPQNHITKRNIQAPEVVGFSQIQEVKNLFTVSPYAPPPWWSRMAMGAHFFAYWRYSGNVSLDVNVDATQDRAPGWAPFKEIHGAIPEQVEAVSPLRDTSTIFHFGDPMPEVAQVLRVGYNRSSTFKGEVMGMWIRANIPPGFQPKFDAFNAVPRTKFYMGKLPFRQLIEIEYDRWYFISSDAEIWQQSISKYSPYLVFWPAEPEEPNPIIEVNAFEMYQVKLSVEDISPEKCMGFIQENTNGNLQILVLGVPGKPAFWRQRLPHLVDVTHLTHTVDKELLTTADTPEEDPPEWVRHRVELLEDSKILEIEIEKMPEPPSPSHLRKIEQAYPLLRNVVSQRGLGVFLMEVKESEYEK